MSTALKTANFILEQCFISGRITKLREAGRFRRVQAWPTKLVYTVVTIMFTIDLMLISRAQMVMKWSDVLSGLPLYSHPDSEKLARIYGTPFAQ